MFAKLIFGLKNNPEAGLAPAVPPIREGVLLITPLW